MVSMPRYALNTRSDRGPRRGLFHDRRCLPADLGDDHVSGLVWSGMSGIGCWMIAVSSQQTASYRLLPRVSGAV